MEHLIPVQKNQKLKCIHFRSKKSLVVKSESVKLKNYEFVSDTNSMNKKYSPKFRMIIKHSNIST